jgi:hypothetical protein
MPSPVSELSFKFRFVNQGQALSQELFAQKGVANEREILLGKEVLIYDDIADTTTRDQRVIIALSNTACLSQKLSRHLVNNSALVLEVYRGKCLGLEKYIDRITSAKEVEKKKQRLSEAGQFHLFQSVTCPECQATIDLSDFERTSYVYCRFCETVFKENLSMTKGSTYRLCDECGMFDRVRSYTEFYFYFLFFVYGFYYKRRHVCDNCADGIFWKMFFLNLLFVIGVPSSLWLKIKSLTGRDPYLKQLAKANGLSKKGNYQTADKIYERLSQRYPEHPGLLLNEGLGHLRGKDATGAVHRFGRALKSCSNYYPALRLLHQLQTAEQQKN